MPLPHNKRPPCTKGIRPIRRGFGHNTHIFIRNRCDGNLHNVMCARLCLFLAERYKLTATKLRNFWGLEKKIAVRICSYCARNIFNCVLSLSNLYRVECYRENTWCSFTSCIPNSRCEVYVDLWSERKTGSIIIIHNKIHCVEIRFGSRTSLNPTLEGFTAIYNSAGETTNSHGVNVKPRRHRQNTNSSLCLLSVAGS